MARTPIPVVLVAALACVAAACTATPPPVPDPSARLTDGSPVAAVAPGPAAAPNGLVFDDRHVQLRLTRTAPGPIAFGLPVPPGRLDDPATIAVTVGGQPVAASATVLLRGHDGAGATRGVRSVQLQLPATAIPGATTDLDITWNGGTTPSAPPLPFATASVESPAVARTAQRTIQQVDGRAALVETSTSTVTLFTGREPAVLVDHPAGYLAATGILGPQVAAGQVGSGLAGLQFVSNEITPFGLSAIHAEGYALNPAKDSVVIPDPQENYEAWLYDRCATFLAFYTHTGDTRFLRYGYRACSHYASKIELSGANRGIFTGKVEPDPKYSHLRGLYAYYALTGDETAKAAGEAVADLWLNDEVFAVPYAQGRLRGPDKIWTERLLGVGMEGRYFGYLLTDRPEYLEAFRKLLDTAHRHITGDPAALAAINPGTVVFPPQNCLIHTAEQHAEGNADEPWCSGWMSELLIPPLLAYQEQTDDPRVDEIFVRLTRFLRDTGSAYFTGDLLDDAFLHPSVAYDAAGGEDVRRLVPLYGSGIGIDGKRRNHGEYDDAQHCLDATALVAAGLRGLRRQGTFDATPVGPFPSEGRSFVALMEEFAACAQRVFTDQTRLKRDPSAWTADMLAPGLADPTKFIADNKIGYPSRNSLPERRLSWWFNAGLLDFALLRDAGVTLETLRPGQIQP